MVGFGSDWKGYRIYEWNKLFFPLDFCLTQIWESIDDKQKERYSGDFQWMPGVRLEEKWFIFH